MNQIGRNTVVTLDYTVSDIDGIVVDEGAEPLVYLHGGYKDLFPRIEAALEGKVTGDKVLVNLQPVEAFGEYDADLIRIDPLDAFGGPVEVGMQIELADTNGDIQLFTVTDSAEGKVVLDGNHPLAGMVLVFECTVQAVRQATKSEIESIKTVTVEI
jgi:FKBP-type peptidyl-prolyl cis-trans isomerase SlyD